MSIIEFLVLLFVAAICGSIGSGLPGQTDMDVLQILF